MNVSGIKVQFLPKDMEAGVSAPLSGEDLYKAQHVFRKRVADTLKRAVERKQEFFEMAGLDNRFINFPIIGAAKITAQEILKVAKHPDNPIKEIVLFVAQEFDLYQKTFEGYVRHVQDGLGKEPFPTTDIIIELSAKNFDENSWRDLVKATGFDEPEGIVLIERSNPPYGWALPGGFIDKGEEAKAAAIREAKEETNLDLEDVRFLGVYEKPGRDPRFLTSTSVFIAKGVGKPQFGDDAKGLQIIPYDKLLQREYAFDHKQIIEDYLAQKS